MTEKEYYESLRKHAEVIDQIRESAHALHEHVNQRYDNIHPYGFHLAMDGRGPGSAGYGDGICADQRERSHKGGEG